MLAAFLATPTKQGACDAVNSDNAKLCVSSDPETCTHSRRDPWLTRRFLRRYNISTTDDHNTASEKLTRALADADDGDIPRDRANRFQQMRIASCDSSVRSSGSSSVPPLRLVGASRGDPLPERRRAAADRREAQLWRWCDLRERHRAVFQVEGPRGRLQPAAAEGPRRNQRSAH